LSAGENPEVSDGVRITTPSGHVFEAYHSQTLLGTEVGTHNPGAFPRHLVGVGSRLWTTPWCGGMRGDVRQVVCGGVQGREVSGDTVHGARG
jgi:hypothetical protein